MQAEKKLDFKGSRYATLGTLPYLRYRDTDLIGSKILYIQEVTIVFISYNHGGSKNEVWYTKFPERQDVSDKNSSLTVQAERF